MIRKLLKIIFIIIAVILVLVVLFFGTLTVLEFKPDPIEPCEVTGSASKELHAGDTLKVVTWNIGYGALGDNADFFMDGGTSVYTADKARVQENITAVSDWLKEQNPRLILLQEIDRDSMRSRSIDETEAISSAIGKGYDMTFANNYKAVFVPFPFPPLGKVDSGLLTLSAYPIKSATRVSLPCPFDWPIRTANLKRCLMVDRIHVGGSDHDFVVVNLHLEAYDTGAGKIEQTRQLAQLLKEEYGKGNYVIAGGDFNQVFSNVDWSMYPADPSKWLPGKIDESAFDDTWTCLMDNSVPTCRSLDQPYAGADKENFQYYLIDGFIVSNNITVKECKTQDLGFVNSDHNPVLMELKLN